MINLPHPIFVTPPPIGDRTFEPLELKSIDYSVVYDNSDRVANAYIKVINRPMLLWAQDDYVKAGNWTDGDVDARITELLGAEPADVLAGLLVNRQPYTPTPEVRILPTKEETSEQKPN